MRAAYLQKQRAVFHLVFDILSRNASGTEQLTAKRAKTVGNGVVGLICKSMILHVCMVGCVAPDKIQFIVKTADSDAVVIFQYMKCPSDVELPPVIFKYVAEMRLE